jgi:hypothetical protein
LGQGVELRVPENAVLADPLGHIFHRRGGEAAVVNTTVDGAGQQAGGFEDAKVFGNGGERDLKRFGELRDGGLAASQAGEDGAAGGVGESAESGVEGGRGIVNHMV